jgi:hypothetical protein
MDVSGLPYYVPQMISSIEENSTQNCVGPNEVVKRTSTTQILRLATVDLTTMQGFRNSKS